ncbi:MAG: acetyltransferase [Deltaproteobacteria bacterium]|nr:acetyltransferase [Deltaproteobacteria bacterium]
MSENNAHSPVFDVFNGDADGICSLQQIRLEEPLASILITDIKQTIRLAERFHPPEGSQVNIFDVSFRDNRTAVERLLAAGCRVRYFDHHIPGDLLEHPLLETHIDTDSAVCTSLLVNAFLGGRQAPWAAVGAFGDNMSAPARSAVSSLGYGEDELRALEELGTLLNYNGYGTSLEDLHFHPVDLYLAVRDFQDPLEFHREAPQTAALREGFSGDLQQAEEKMPVMDGPEGKVFLFPHSAWARRVMGVFANKKARENPTRATAVGVENADGTLRVSVRAPLERPRGANDLCRKFPNGGGRAGAGAINNLPLGDMDRFLTEFRDTFRS